jgi:pimeloyl-ACP methyl ester carboxylesterase
MQLASRSAGAGGRPLLLLHGLGGSSTDFSPHLDALAARGWHAVALDLRGHGRSPRPEREESYAVDLLVEDVLTFATEMGWLDFVLLGHEAGGVIAQEVALRSPGRVGGLLLQSTWAGAIPVDRNLAEGGIELVRGTDSMKPIEVLDGRAHDCAPSAYASIFAQLLDAPDRSLRLAEELRLPTLAVVGVDDDLFLESTVDLAAIIPSADLELINHCGRHPHLDCPERWADLVGGFLAASRV